MAQDWLRRCVRAPSLCVAKHIVPCFPCARLAHDLGSTLMLLLLHTILDAEA